MHGPSDDGLFDILRPRTVWVNVLGLEWALHLDVAYHWLGAIGLDMGGLAGVVPGAISHHQLPAMFDLSLQHQDIDHRWENAARVAVQRGSGRDWWWTVNLTRKCLESWTYVNGLLRIEGVIAQQTPFPDWLDAAYALMWRNADESQRQKLDMELRLMPLGARPLTNTEQSKRMALAFAAD